MIEYSGTTPSTYVTIRNRYSMRTILVISTCIHTYEINSSVYGMCTVFYCIVQFYETKFHFATVFERLHY